MGAIAASGLIQKTPDVCGSEARVGNHRITVWMLVNARRLGLAEQQLLADYPMLSTDDLHAAWDYYVMHPREIDEAILRNQSVN